MTRTDLFKKAHEIARQTKEIAGSYRLAFACALKALYNGEIDMEKTIEEKLIAAGASAWEKGEYKRIYLSESVVRDLGFTQGTSGCWYANPEDEATRIRSNSMNSIISRAFYDCNAKTWNFSRCSVTPTLSEAKEIFVKNI